MPASYHHYTDFSPRCKMFAAFFAIFLDLPPDFTDIRKNAKENTAACRDKCRVFPPMPLTIRKIYAMIKVPNKSNIFIHALSVLFLPLGKNARSFLHTRLGENQICLATIGAVRFSVRRLWSAHFFISNFFISKEKENEKQTTRVIVGYGHVDNPLGWMRR